MFYIFIIIIIVGVILNSLCKKYALDKVQYSRSISAKYVECGEKFNIVTSVENRKMLPVTFLQVKEYVGESKIYNCSNMMILPYQRVTRTYEKSLDKRGRYYLRKVDITAGDFIGIDVVTKSQDFEDEIIVYPKPMDIDNDMDEIGEFIGETSVKRWIVEDPIVTMGIREYTGFEPEKNIHWPSSLRTGQLMVRNFDFTSDNSVFIILNIDENKDLWIGTDEENIEKCYSLVRTLIDDFEEAKVKYGFITNATGINKNGYVAPSLGESHYFEMLNNLGTACSITSMNFTSLINTTIEYHLDCRTIIIVTPVIPAESVSEINKLASYAEKNIVFSMRGENIEKLDDNIVKFVLGRENI